MVVGQAEGERLPVKLYTTADGLAHNSVNRIVRDSRGFLVRAVNADGVMSAPPASFSFTILPPLWQRWWVVTMVAFLVAGVAYALYRYRVMRLLELERVRAHCRRPARRHRRQPHEDRHSQRSRASA